MKRMSNNYQSWSKKELIKRITQLESKSTNLTSIQSSKTGKSSRKTKSFDFGDYCQRKIALKFAYFGWDMDGLAEQESSRNTVEEYLFDALIKSKMVSDIKLADYSRCGRTDKGVSAISQVVSLNMRSNIPPSLIQDKLDANGEPKIHPPNQMKQISTIPESWDESKEHNYTSVLNGLLPPEIRILSWSSAPIDFSARFHCTSRRYKYFFHRHNLNINSMIEAIDYIRGSHDFRHFSKIGNSEFLINN